MRERPWVRITARCDICGDRAYRRIEGDDQLVRDACAAHAGRVLDEVSEPDGFAFSSLHHMTWRFWFLHRFWPTRWIGSWQIARHNRAFDLA